MSTVDGVYHIIVRLFVCLCEYRFSCLFLLVLEFRCFWKHTNSSLYSIPHGMDRMIDNFILNNSSECVKVRLWSGLCRPGLRAEVTQSSNIYLPCVLPIHSQNTHEPTTWPSNTFWPALFLQELTNASLKPEHNDLL